MTSVFKIGDEIIVDQDFIDDAEKWSEMVEEIDKLKWKNGQLISITKNMIKKFENLYVGDIEKWKKDIKLWEGN